MKPYIVIKINTERQKTSISASSPQSATWTEELEFKEVDPTTKKVYFELVLYDKVTKY